MDFDIRGTPYPHYVESSGQRRRWDYATLIALGINKQAVDAGSAYPFPDLTFVWHTTRTIYNDPAVTESTAEEFEADVREAVKLGLIDVLDG